MACECELAGWCERHKVSKSPHLVHLCQTHDSYYTAWEEGRGPRQIGPGTPRIIREPDPVCVHRGEVAGSANCGCCGNQKVYTCELHGLAMERKLKPGLVPIELADGEKRSVDMRYCGGCEDFSE